MGGIVGKLSFEPRVEISPATVGRMIAAIAHRGCASRADVSATYLGDGIALACCGGDGSRSAHVARNETGTVLVVADADLSNAAALRRSLESTGHLLATDDDAEVMAHAYEEWGDACVGRFCGPFACAIWDDERRRLLLARDHVGIRPLCFALLNGRGVVFGSNITALVEDPSVGREWNPEGIDAYLALGYVPSPLTIYRRVSKLEPAHTLVVEGRRLTTRQYWDFPAEAETAESDREALDSLDSLLRGSVVQQAGSAAGVLLSGGVASTLIAGMAPRGRPVVAIDTSGNPMALVRAMNLSAHLGLRGQIDRAMPDAADTAAFLARYFDEPSADPAAVEQYTVLAMARSYLPVAVTGHGAAALWAGYGRHRLERVEHDMRSVLVGPLARLGSRVGQALAAAGPRAAALSHLTLPAAGAYATKHSYGLFDEERRHAVYTRGFSSQVRGADPLARHVDAYDRCGASDPLTRALYVDARTFLPDGHLAVADRVAAAAAMRLRHPFLDPDVAVLAFALPNRLKLRRTAGMLALRQLAARRLPRTLLPPAGRAASGRPWLAAAVSALVPGLMLTERFDTRGIFSRPALAALWDEHRAGRRDHTRRLWSLLMLELWFRAFIDGDAAAQPPEYAVLRAA